MSLSLPLSLLSVEKFPAAFEPGTLYVCSSANSAKGVCPRCGDALYLDLTPGGFLDEKELLSHNPEWQYCLKDEPKRKGDPTHFVLTQNKIHHTAFQGGDVLPELAQSSSDNMTMAITACIASTC